MDVPVLIPAYNPDQKLVNIVTDLFNIGFTDIIIINDGSNNKCDNIFKQLSDTPGCHVLKHIVNLGKGRALKTGMNYFYDKFNNNIGVVTADADGQHSANDILNIAKELKRHANNLILGVRKFSKDVPLRSLIGNVMTKYVFKLFVGKKISDTQSGLRGIPKKIIPELVRIHGERYEYEMNMLIFMKQNNIDISEISIETIYLENNSSSHFNPLFDSMKIYFLLLRFVFSSFITSIIDFIIFFIGFKVSKSILISIILGRIVASVFNFFVNKKIVFNNDNTIIRTVSKYYFLVIVLGTFSYLLIEIFVLHMGISVNVAKIISETILFIMSFSLQRDIVFINKKRGLDEKD